MNDKPLMLRECGLNCIDIENIFGIFKQDFIKNIVYFKTNNSLYSITVKPDNLCNCPFSGTNKPERFWHIITTKVNDFKKRNNPCPDNKEKNRVYCHARASRIHWIRQIIEGYPENNIKYFFEDSTRTHFLWDMNRFYIVLIKELGKTENLLVTAFPVHKNKYREYLKKLKNYEHRIVAAERC